MQGEAVTYMVASALLLLERAIFVIAFASAWRTYGLVKPFSSSQTFSNPEGVPLYPSEIIILSFIIRAPTWRRVQ